MSSRKWLGISGLVLMLAFFGCAAREGDSSSTTATATTRAVSPRAVDGETIKLDAKAKARFESMSGALESTAAKLNGGATKSAESQLKASVHKSGVALGKAAMLAPFATKAGAR